MSEVNPIISEVIVEGLHNQFDFEIKLQRGLNVIYGKNGRGKTTLLHLLANLLELDFERFGHIQFRKIKVRTNFEECVELKKDRGGHWPQVYLNGVCTSFDGTNSSLGEAENAELRKALGARSTYLPAFRLILERARQESSTLIRQIDRRQEMESIVKREASEIPQKRIGAALFGGRRHQEEATLTAEKTILCRHWFGSFVPVVRYPSITDVQEGLSQERQQARWELISREQRMFENTFLTVLKTISGAAPRPQVLDKNELISELDKLIADPTFKMQGRSFASSVAALKDEDYSLLQIYREALELRDAARREAFQKVRDFEESANRFFSDSRDGKKLNIGISEDGSTIPSVQSENGQSCLLPALSSGERQILTMLYSASRSRSMQGVFLIDEPELSLHIDWQRIILTELSAQSPNRQIIACTHSPEVGADHLTANCDFEPRITKQLNLPFEIGEFTLDEL